MATPTDTDLSYIQAEKLGHTFTACDRQNIPFQFHNNGPKNLTYMI